MKIIVSRRTLWTTDGRRVCSKCQRRTTKRTGNRWRSYCSICHSEYMREQRRGKVTRLLTPAEWAVVQLARELEQPLTIEAADALRPAGRHARV